MKWKYTEKKFAVGTPGIGTQYLFGLNLKLLLEIRESVEQMGLE